MHLLQAPQCLLSAAIVELQIVHMDWPISHSMGSFEFVLAFRKGSAGFVPVDITARNRTEVWVM